MYQYYVRKKGTWARPYIPGESLEGVSVSDGDTPSIGGLIARNPDNSRDRWYIAAEYAEKHLRLSTLAAFEDADGWGDDRLTQSEIDAAKRKAKEASEAVVSNLAEALLRWRNA